MKKWLAIAVAAVLFAGGAAVVWPTSGPGVPAPVPATDGSRRPMPDFAQVNVQAANEGLALTGAVLDPMGKAVPGAEVFLVSSAQASLASVRCEECAEPLLSCRAHPTGQHVLELVQAGRGVLTAAATTRADGVGKFRFERLAGVSFTVWARADGLGESVRERAAPGDPVELFLPALRAIAGTVNDDHGKPIAGAHLWAFSRRLPIPREVKSDGAGVFELKGLGEGPFYVIAEAIGFLPAVAQQVEAGPTMLRLVLARERRLEVQVRSAGKPVDATVRVTADHLAREAVATSGLARFDKLYPDEVVVSASLGQQSSAPRTLALHDSLTRLVLDLEPGGTVSVTAIDEQGMPVPEPDLALLTIAGEVVAKKKGKTGELVMFGPVAEGNYLLRGASTGYKLAELPVVVKGGEASVELVMGKGTTIAGTVLDEYGRPAPGVSILMNPTGESVLADDQGKFVAAVPSPGLYQLHAHHSDWGGGSLPVTAPAAGVELHLEPRAGVQVTVTAGGRRVEGANVVLWIEREGSFRSDRPSSADGLVTMRGMPAGTYSMVAGHPEYLPSERQRVTVEEGSLLKLTAELKPGGTISGVVIDSQGAPVTGAAVSVIPRSTEPTTTDGLGHFELRPLRTTAPYRVEVRHPAYEQTERVLATANGPALKITLKRRNAFRGRVVGEDLKPLKHFRIDDHEVDSADGRFELPLSSAEDRVIFGVEAPGHQALMVDRPASPDLGDLVLARAPRSAGVVRDEAGGPVADAVVTCDVCDESVLSGTDGRFALSTPPYVTQYVVTARKGGLAGSRPVQAGATAPVEVTLRGAVRLSGHAYLANGKPAAGVELEGMNVDRSEPVTVVTAQDGSYSIEVPAGSYRFGYDDGAPRQRGGFGDPLAIVVDVQGTSARLDFGPAPGTGSVTLRVKPERGYALWLVRGDLSSVGNPPVELLRSGYAQLHYQPLQERVTLQGLPPGRYTAVWANFHIETPGGALLQRVNVPAPGEVLLVR